MIINYDVNNKGGGGASAEGCVRYDQQQELTNEQQQQARENIGAGTGNLEDAPSDNKQYARKNGEWEEVEGGGTAPLIITKMDFEFLTPSQFGQLVTAFESGRTAIIHLNESDDIYYQVFHCSRDIEGYASLFVSDSYSIKRLYIRDPFDDNPEVACENIDLLPEAPSNGKQYARKNKGWVEVQGGGAAPLIINTLDFAEIPPEQFVQLSMAFESGRTAIIHLNDGSDLYYQVIYESLSYEGYTSIYVTDGSSVKRLYIHDPETNPEVRCETMSLVFEAPSNGKQYARKNKGWVEVQGGGEAVQSDWNETDSDDPTFIKNKPTILEPFVVDVNDHIGRLTAAQIMQLYEAFTAGRPTFIKAKTQSGASAVPELMQIIAAEDVNPSGSPTVIYMYAIGSQYVHNIQLVGEYVQCSIRSFFSDVNNNNKTYARRNQSWVELPAIPEPENHQIVRNALASTQTIDPNEWAELCCIEIPEDGAYQVSALVKPVKVGTAEAATINVALRQKHDSDVTELAEIELQPNRVTGCMARAINALRGDILVIESYSTVQYGIQAQPSVGKAHATYLEAVRVGATYTEPQPPLPEEGHGLDY